jgi:hypothetical protein
MVLRIPKRLPDARHDITAIVRRVEDDDDFRSCEISEKRDA